MIDSLRSVPFALNGPIIGHIMKECVRRAILAIRAGRFSFIASAKGQKDDGRTDWVTDVDVYVQRIYVKLLGEAFPDFGIIAEEEELSVPCSIPEVDIYFTVDPLDGTSAFKRQASTGFGTMISLVMNGEIIAACIGDAMTQEIYYYRPVSNKTHRIDEAGHAIELTIDPDRPLGNQYLHLREPPDWPNFRQQTRRLTVHRHMPFKSLEVSGGSIGLSMARMWKGEVGACVISSEKVTPWDDTPIVGISKRLGFVFLKPTVNGWTQIDPRPSKEIIRPTIRDTLVLHSSRLSEFAEWCYRFPTPITLELLTD